MGLLTDPTPPSSVDKWSDWIQIAIFGVAGAGGIGGLAFVLRQLIVILWNNTKAEIIRLRDSEAQWRKDWEEEHTMRIAAEKRADAAEDSMDDMKHGRTPTGGGEDG